MIFRDRINKQNKELSSVADSVLVERFQSGDRLAFDEIDRRYRDRLTSYIKSRVKSLDVAEEIVQETLTRALVSLKTIKRGDFLSHWLYKIAYRVLVDNMRRQQTKIGAAVPINDDKTITVTDNAETLTFSSLEGTNNGIYGVLETCSVSEYSRKNDSDNIWRVAKGYLSVREFHILWLTYVDEMDASNIAKSLGIKEGTIRVILCRAKKKMTKLLKVQNQEKFL